MAKQTTALEEAQAGIRPAVEKVIALGGRCMEQTCDRAGIVWERWLLPNGSSVILFGTPHWRDVFVSVAPRASLWTQTLEALDIAAREGTS